MANQNRGQGKKKLASGYIQLPQVTKLPGQELTDERDV
jgi:hypothetical protein